MKTNARRRLKECYRRLALAQSNSAFQSPTALSAENLLFLVMQKFELSIGSATPPSDDK